MRLLVEYTSHGRGPAAPQTYTTTLDIVDDVAERLLKAKTCLLYTSPSPRDS